MNKEGVPGGTPSLLYYSYGFEFGRDVACNVST